MGGLAKNPLRRCRSRLPGRLLLSTAAAFGVLLHAVPAIRAEQFQADEWRAECTGSARSECTIIVPFRPHRRDGSFALAFDMRSGVLAIVGDPPPLAATLRIDKNREFRCSGPRYCLFSVADSEAAAGQLAAGSIALIDVATGDGSFHSSLSAKGYRAALAKIRSWAYPPAASAARTR